MENANHKRTIVFDLDGSLETPYFDKSKSQTVKEWMTKHQVGNSFDKMYVEVMEDKLPHFFLNGAFELLQWVHERGFEIVFFSNAVEERNRELCPILMERAFSGLEIPPYRILSRGDCVDTRYMCENERTKYQGLWFGNYKKKLAGIVVPEDNLPNTLMLEDDNSYAAKGEERNFVYGVYGGLVADFIYSPKLSEEEGQDFHLPFYFCGILARIVKFADHTGVSLADAAVQVQYADYKYDFPQDGKSRKDSSGSWMNPPYPPQREFRLFNEGFKELQAFNPNLRFWGATVDENTWKWPELNAPPPPPPKPKPKIKTDMTMMEAKYWLYRLRKALCKISWTNVKFISLRDEKGNYLVHFGEGDRYFPLRQTDFPDDNYLDRKQIRRIDLSGYLPCKIDDTDLLRRQSCMGLYRMNYESNIIYEIFQRYIADFMRDCFELLVNWEDFEVTDPEHWSISVLPNTTLK